MTADVVADSGHEAPCCSPYSTFLNCLEDGFLIQRGDPLDGAPPLDAADESAVALPKS